MHNTFKIIVPSYNNEKWVEYNLASILNQTYIHYKVLYINDSSTDNTLNLVENIVKHNDKFSIVNNEINKGAAHNYVEFVQDFVEDEDIIVHLDGDDWFIDEDVLSKLNQYYKDKKCLMTYGQFLAWDGENYVNSNPQGTPHSDFVHEYKLYRRDAWRASHLRTYKGKLFKAIKIEDSKDLKNKEYYWHGIDLAWAYAAMEMCTKDQIGVVDFYTHVYNQSPTNKTRTSERESLKNQHYENEIRNRKHYKEGLTGDKLPQVNVIGDYRERNSIPKSFSYVYNLSEGEFDITLIQDMDCVKYINGEINVSRGIIVADIHEPPYLFQQQQVYDLVYENYDKFDLILTYDKKLLTRPNAVFRNGGGEVVLNKNVHKQEYPNLADDSLQRIYKKTNLVSFITSNKTFTDGHRFRVACVNRIEKEGLSIPVFGVGYKEVTGKIEALKDYAYSIAIENGDYENYFTEKILDCLLTGTIPIYKGCKNIGDYFDINGIITFDTEDELVNILSNLTEEFFNSNYDAILKNFELAKKYAYNNDTLFDRHLKLLI